MLEGPHIWLDESIWKDLWLIFCLSICIIIISLEMGGDVKEAFSKLGGHRNWWFINVNQTEVKTYLSWSVSKFKKKIMEKRPFSLPIFDFQTQVLSNHRFRFGCVQASQGKTITKEISSRSIRFSFWFFCSSRSFEEAKRKSAANGSDAKTLPPPL